MKKYLSLFVVLALAISVGASAVKAEDRDKDDSSINNKTLREQFKQEIQTRREEAKSKIEALRESLKNEKDAAKAKIVEFRLQSREKALNGFDHVAKNLTEKKDRVAQIAVNLKAKGIDTAKAEGFIATADTKIGDMNVKITAANELLGKSSEQLSDTDKASLKTLAKDIQALAKDTRDALHSAVLALKDGVKAKMAVDASLKVKTENNITNQ